MISLKIRQYLLVSNSFGENFISSTNINSDKSKIEKELENYCLKLVDYFRDMPEFYTNDHFTKELYLLI